MCSIPSSILTDQRTAAVYCAQSSNECFAICANPDISGIGVRAAFYAQSVISAVLVALSPRDSVPAAWAGTLLTTALIIAAIIQKANQELTLHHATLIMNFATLSCISSLAVAPKLPIWHLRPHEYIAGKLVPHTISEPTHLNLFSQHVGNIMDTEFPSQARHRVKAAQTRERLIFVLSLSVQVILQWTWATILFVSPVYGQQECSSQTELVLFLRPFSVGDIDVSGKYALWPTYLLCCVSSTLALWVRLVLSSSARAHELLSRSSTISIGMARPRQMSTSKNPLRFLKDIWRWMALLRKQDVMFWMDVFWFTLWLLYIVASELQIRSNCIFSGENEIQSFGQITAVLLISSSLWSLVVAIYRYPSLLRKQARRRRAIST